MTGRATDHRTLRLALIGAPIAWYALFWVAYLLAEWYCTEIDSGDVVLGLDPLSITVLVLTSGTVLAIAAVTVIVGRRAAPEARLMGYILGGVFIVATIMLGLPALVLEPC